MKALTDRIKECYGLQVSKCKVIKDVHASVYVAKVITDKGTYVIKGLYEAPERQRFIVETEAMLAERNVPIAKPIPTLDDKLFIMLDSNPFVLYEWVKGPPQSLRNIHFLEESARAIAEFHKASKGLKYPLDMKIYAHTDWLEEYKERLRRIKMWSKNNKETANPRKKAILRAMPHFHKAAKRAIKEPKNSSYQDIIHLSFPSQTLVHGDMHHYNFIRQKNVLAMIDFEDVRYDLPSKDLIRLFSMYTSRNSFTTKSYKKMINAYLESHSLPPNEQKLLHIDFLFPHLVERMIRKRLYLKWNVKRVKHFLKQEKRKVKAVQKMLQ